jgi:hypothetical protein
MIKLFALLPIISMALLFATFNRQGLSHRRSLLSAAVAWGVILTTITEMLSIAHLLNFRWLSIIWVLTITVQTYIYSYVTATCVAHDEYPFTPFTKLLLFCIGGIVVLTGITAVIAPPNNYDSMAYHMSRVMHWIYNQSVAHYPTSVLSQIELPPWAEFAITNFQILSKGDHFANFVQWFCMVSCILGVTLIAEKLGADHRGQIIAAVFAATIPMAILQSSSTQNDCVLSFWLVCLVYFGIQFNEKPCWSYASGVGASLGLSLLTKGTAYLFVFPLLIWLAISSLKSIKFRALKYMVLIIFIAISLNVGHYIRNYETFGNIFSSGEIKYSNDNYRVTSLVSNMIRNMALEMSSQFEYANRLILSGVRLLHTTMRLNINDRATTWKRTEFNISSARHEDVAGSPIHLLLIIFTTISISCGLQANHNHAILPYLVVLVIAFLCFSSYLIWQPYHNRLLLPLIIIWSPIVALVLADTKVSWTTNSIALGLVIMALPFALLNPSRPIISVTNTKSIFKTDRLSQYFNNYPKFMQKYHDIAHHLKNIDCRNVAIRTGGFTWEYPLWVLLQEEFNQSIRIEYVDVENKSGKIPLNNFNYCEVVSIDRPVWTAYSWGTKLDFSAQSTNAEPYMIQGWSTPEDWGVWSVGEKAVVGFTATQPTEDMVLELGAPRIFAKQPVEVVVNGESVCHFFDFDSAKNISIPVTKAILTKKSPITIEFLTPQYSSPLSHGISDDARLLGIGLRSLTLMPGGGTASRD